jgi:hypothetical protein
LVLPWKRQVLVPSHRRINSIWAASVEAKFVEVPLDQKERTQFEQFVFGNLVEGEVGETGGEFVPSSKIRVVEGGLEFPRRRRWMSGRRGLVSGEKIVLEA